VVYERGSAFTFFLCHALAIATQHHIRESPVTLLGKNYYCLSSVSNPLVLAHLRFRFDTCNRNLKAVSVQLSGM
jgi:hypothetical protein